MNTIDPHRLQELVRDPDQLLRQLGGDGVSFRTGPLPDPSEAASPRAVALCCSDMRELPERILGSAFGPISTLQSAGALLTPTMEASIRYALATTDARVLVVLGHLRCRLLEHCWAGRPRPFVLEDLLDLLVECSACEHFELLARRFEIRLALLGQVPLQHRLDAE